MADDRWVERCRLEHESSETWAKKRRFLLAYCHRLKKDRLLWLAQVYVNIREKHASYPKELMDEVAALAAGLGQLFPNEQPASRNRDMNNQPASRNREMNNQPASRDREMNNQPASRNRDMNNQPASRNREMNNQPASRDREMNNQPASRNREMNNQPASRNRDMNDQPSSRNRDINAQPASRNRDINAQPASRNRDMNNQPSSRNRDMNAQPASRNRDMNNQPASRNRDMSNQSASRNRDMNDRPASRNRNMNDQPASRNRDMNGQLNLRRVATVLSKMSTQDQYACERIDIACTKMRVLHKVVYCKVDRLSSNPLWRADVYFDGVRLASSDAEKNKNTAKHKAYQAAELRLRELPHDTTIAAAPGRRDKLKEPKLGKRAAKMQSSVEAKRVHVDEKVHVPGLIVLEPECFNGSINDVSILQNSVTASHLKMECYHRLLVEQHSRRNPVYRCRVMIDNKVVSEATGPSKPGAKELACKLALDTLRKTHPVIKVHDAANIPNVFLSDLKSSEQTDRLGSNNIGMKMLQNMGWTGGGIGKKGSEGIKDPITVHDIYQGHRGLGHVGSSTKLLAKGVKKLLTDYIQSYEENDLVFSLELSKDERELVRQAAQKLGLKSQTKNRYLTIKRKQHPTEILHQLVVNGGRYGRYELISKAGGESQALNYKDKLESLSNSYPKRLMGEVRTLAADNGELLKYRGNTVACMRSEDGSTWDSRRQMLDAKRRKLPQPVTVMMKSTYGQQTFVGKRGNHDDSPPGYRDVLATQGHSSVKRKREREILPVQPKRQCSKSERTTSPVEPRSKRQHCKPQRTHTSVEQLSKRERSPDLKEQRFDRHQWECERRSYKPERTPDLEELRSERQRRESDRRLPKYERTLKVEEPRSEQQRRESERRLSKHEQTTKVEEPRSERQRQESERRHSKYERTPEREESRSERQHGESERRNSKHERTLPEVQCYRSRRTPSPEEPRPKRTADVDEPRTAEPSSGRRSAHEHKRIGSVRVRAHHTR